MNTKAGELAVEAFAKGFSEGHWRGKLEAVDDLCKVLPTMRQTDKRRAGLKWAIRYLGNLSLPATSGAERKR